MSAEPATALDWDTLLTPHQQRDRARLLPQLMLVTNPDCLAHPQALYLTDADLARRIVTENTIRLEKACKVLASRGRRGHWTYDLPTHHSAVAVLQAERRLKAALDRDALDRDAIKKDARDDTDRLPVQLPGAFV